MRRASGTGVSGRRLTSRVAAAALVLAGVLAPAAAAAPAQFQVGASVATIDPSYPVYMGGYGGGPSGGTIARHVDPLSGRPEDFTVRAIAIVGGGHVDEIATVDTQGYFAGYQEGPYGISDVRAAVAGYLRAHGVATASPADIIVSSEHEHAAPTVIGIWGPPTHQFAYLRQVAAALTAVLEQAYDRARPATITWGSADAPWVADRVISEGNAFEGWPRDGSLGAIWARDAQTGATIATFATEPGYPNIVYGPGDLLGPGGKAGAVLSSDFPNYADAYLERRLGGVAIVTDGTLGNQTSALQTDNAPSPDLAGEDGMASTRAFDDIIHMGQLIGSLTIGALAAGHEISDPVVQAAEQYVQSPVYNPLLIADNEVAPVGGGAFWAAVTGNALYPTDRSFTPPYGDGAALGTWVTALRIGDLLFTSMPGEFFPSTHEAWQRGINGPAGDFVIGAAQDFLGYEYPVYAFPFTLQGSDEAIFNPSLTLGDQVVVAGEQDAQALGFSADQTSNAEYSALESQYTRQLEPGVQFLPFPLRGDLDPRGGSFTPVLEGVSQPARDTTTQGVCLADTLTACPFPPPPMGAFHWGFGDGSTAMTPPQTYARAYFSPFVAHRYCAAGTYQVSVSATDSGGRTDGMALPVTVYPPLSVRIVQRAGALQAVVSGGSGQALYVHWSGALGDRYGDRAPAGSASGQVTVTVVDGTGTVAAAQTSLVSGRAGSSQPLSVSAPDQGGLLGAAPAGAGGSCTTTSSRTRGGPACLSRRTILVTLPRRRGLRVRSVQISVQGARPVLLRGQRRRVRLTLRGRPRSRYRVTLVVRTVRWTGSGRRRRAQPGPSFVSHRTYRTCAPRISHRRRGF